MGQNLLARGNPPYMLTRPWRWACEETEAARIRGQGSLALFSSLYHREDVLRRRQTWEHCSRRMLRLRTSRTNKSAEENMWGYCTCTLVWSDNMAITTQQLQLVQCYSWIVKQHTVYAFSMHSCHVNGRSSCDRRGQNGLVPELIYLQHRPSHPSIVFALYLIGWLLLVSLFNHFVTVIYIMRKVVDHRLYIYVYKLPRLSRTKVT